MPNWKKLIVSGSDASLNSLSVTTNVTAQSFTGSFSGSFTAPGATTQVVYNNGGVLAASSNFVFSGSNVGIGVSDPTYKLHISSSNNGDGLAIHYPDTNNTVFPFYVGAVSGNYFRANASVLELKRNGAASTIKTAGSTNNLVLESATNLMFNTNGASERMRIDTSGNVGIGTTSPAYTFEVAGIGSFRNIGAQLLLNGGFGAYEFATTTGNALTISLSGTAERMRILSDGNIGINTTAPGDKLEVVGNVYANAFNSVGTLSRYNSSGGIAIAGLAGNSYAYISAYVNGAGAGKNLALQPNSGSVGIGTTNPSATLEVSGNVKAVSFTGSFSGSINTAVSASYALSASYTNYALTASYALNAGDSVWTASAGDIYYNGGNVGIGLTNPSYKLHLVGGSEYITGGLSGGNSSPYTSANRLIFSNDYNDVARGPNKITLYDASWLGGLGIHDDTVAYYSGGTHKWYQATNASNAVALMSLNSSGNLGLGTTAPAYKLDVYGSPRFYGDGNHIYARVSSGASNKDSYLVFNNTADRFYVGVPASSNSLYLQSANGGTPVSLVADYTSGNVGIGITSPSAKLHVSGSGFYENGTLTVQAYSGLYGVGNPTLSLTYLGSQYGNHAIGDAWNYIINNPYSSTSQGGIELATQGTTRLTVTKAGLVGIGTTGPTSTLDAIVSSGGTSGFRFRGYSDAGTSYLLSLGTYTYPDQFQINSVNGLVTMGIVGATGANPDLAFQTNTTERMRIATGGNIGIGSTAPNATLDILTGASDSTGNSFSFTGYSSKTYVSISKLGFIRTRASDLNGANMHFLDNGGTKRIEMSVNTTSMNWYSDALAADFLYFKHTTGNIGIGTASPTQKLDVAGAISVSGSVVDYEVAPGLIGAGPSTNIISFTPGTHYAAFVDYVIKDASTGANQRVGTIMVSISLAGAAAVMNEVVTTDIGNTSAITFSVTYGAPTWLVAANSGITPYDINYMVRYF